MKTLLVSHLLLRYKPKSLPWPIKPSLLSPGPSPGSCSSTSPVLRCVSLGSLDEPCSLPAWAGRALCPQCLLLKCALQFLLSSLISSFVFQILSLSWGSLLGSQSWLSFLHYILLLNWVPFLCSSSSIWIRLICVWFFSQWPPPKYKLHGGKIHSAHYCSHRAYHRPHIQYIFVEWTNRELVSLHLLLFDSLWEGRLTSADFRFGAGWLLSLSRGLYQQIREKEKRGIRLPASWLRSWL